MHSIVMANRETQKIIGHYPGQVEKSSKNSCIFSVHNTYIQEANLIQNLVKDWKWDFEFLLFLPEFSASNSLSMQN